MNGAKTKERMWVSSLQVQAVALRTQRMNRYSVT
ncbi:hypothetical protein B0G82_1069 [Paraburkholderia sp. BL17N1]|nr:hypothetical protein B0G82_1069 [Paraburkholderia sp. BL17N1]